MRDQTNEQPQYRTIVAGGRLVGFVDSGEGEPVVLIHSGGADSGQWAPLMARSAAGRRFLAIDLYGVNETVSWTENRRMTMDDEADLVAALIEWVGEPVHVVAHSYGAAVALRLALKRSELLITLSLLEVLGAGLAAQAGYRVLVEQGERFLQLMEAGKLEEATQGFVDSFAGMRWRDLPDAGRQRFMTLAKPGVSQWHAQLSEPTRLEDLAKIDVPSQVCCGTRTLPLSRTLSRRIHQAIPGSFWVDIPDGTHAFPITHAAVVTSALESFWTTAKQERMANGTRTDLITPDENTNNKPGATDNV